MMTEEWGFTHCSRDELIHAIESFRAEADRLRDELKERREDAKRCEKMATLFREILILKGHDVMVCQCIYCASIHSAARGK